MRRKIENSDGFLTLDAAAHFVGLSHWTVRPWLHEGLLALQKSASRTTVSRSEVPELL